MKSTLTPRKKTFQLGMKTFVGDDKNTYLVFRTTGKEGGNYHVFVEVEAKKAASACGASKTLSTTDRKWDSLWK